MKRTPLARKTSFRRRGLARRRERVSRYRRRERDIVFMVFVKTLCCSAVEEWPQRFTKPTPCWGVIEADHAGRRGVGRKADDRTCIPLCKGHHRERTDHTGTFKHVKREDERAWKTRAIERTQKLYSDRAVNR